MEKFNSPGLKIFLIIFLFLLSFSVSQTCLGADNLGNAFGSGPLRNAAVSAGYNVTTDDTQAPLITIIQTVINIALSVMGVIFLVLMVYAGYNWMTARGDEQKVSKAKDIITQSVVGLIIVISAYAISNFVISRIEKGTLKGASAGQTLARN